MAAAKALYEGEVEDVLAAPATFHTKEGNVGLVIRAVNFFESDYFLLTGDSGEASCRCRAPPM